MGEHLALRLLLDTHVWIWALLRPEELNAGAALQLEDPENELWLSPVSVWETLLLAERDRIELDAPPERWVDDALRDFPLRDATLTRAVAMASRAIDLPHEDPADRFIAASAIVHDLVLVTRDERMLSSTRCQLLPA
jgi:PIN domain nuclease of toxin-antitoxin system